MIRLTVLLFLLLLKTGLLFSVDVIPVGDRFKVHYYVDATNLNDTIQIAVSTVIENISDDTIYYPKRNTQTATGNPQLPMVVQFTKRKQYKLKENVKISIPGMFSGTYGWDSLIIIPPGKHIICQVKYEFVNNKRVDTVRFEFIDNILLHGNFNEAAIFFESGKNSSLNPYSDSEFQYFKYQFIYLSASNTILKDEHED